MNKIFIWFWAIVISLLVLFPNSGDAIYSWTHARLFGTASYPTSLDTSTTLPNPGATDSVATISHSALHTNENGGIIAVETKIGTGASTPTANTLLVGTGTGISSWLSSFIYTSSTSTSATSTNLFSTNLWGTFGNITNLLATNSTTTNATSTTFALLKPSLQNCGGSSGALQTASDGTITCGTIVTTGATVTTLIPFPNFPQVSAPSNTATTSNTTLHLGMVNFPQGIVANRVTLSAGSVTTAGTVKMALFSADGQTQLFSVTSGSISTNFATASSTLSAVTISAGNYYMAWLANGTADFPIISYTTDTSNNYYDLISGETAFNSGVTGGKAVLEGKLTVTASTMPATINPTAITISPNQTPIVRLDN